MSKSLFLLEVISFWREVRYFLRSWGDFSAKELRKAVTNFLPSYTFC